MYLKQAANNPWLLVFLCVIFAYQLFDSLWTTRIYNLAPMVGELLVYLEQAVNLWLLVFLVSGARGPGETAISEGQRSK